MKTALFILLPLQSHLMPCFNYARSLQEKGYRVVFTGNNKLKNLVETEKFYFYEFNYAIEYHIKTFRAFVGVLFKSIIDKRFLKLRYKEFYGSIIATEKICEELNPSLVFIDEGAENYYLVFKRLNIKSVFINTKLSIKKVRGIPPYNSKYEPTNTLTSKFVCELVWLMHFIVLEFKRQILKIAFLYKDESFFQKKFCMKNGMNFKGLIDEKNYFHPIVKNISTLVLAPQALEFPFLNNSSDEMYFHTTITRDESHYMDRFYRDLINTINIGKRDNEHLKIVYCSFGTLSRMNLIFVYKFLVKLINIVKTESNILLVISKGKVTYHLPEYNNIFCLDFLPQVDLLRYCDLMITHGGLGTIKECYDANVPMLIFPLNKKVDQNGNAVRVKINGFGLKGDVINDSELQIKNKMYNMLGSDKYKLAIIKSKQSTTNITIQYT